MTNNTNAIAHPFAGLSPPHIPDDSSSDEAWSNAHANFLSSLLPEETRDLLRYSNRLILKSRDYLFTAGDQSENVYLVADGCIRLVQTSVAGKETILWFNFPGELFGMAELWSGSQRQIHAIANQPSQVYAIKREDFVKFLGDHPEAAMKAIGILSARFRALGQTLVGLTSDNVETRVARLLIRLAAISLDSRCEKSQGSAELCVNVRLTHQDIANLIGASRQTVSTTLAHFKKQGTVRVEGHHMHISQPDVLHYLIESENC